MFRIRGRRVPPVAVVGAVWLGSLICAAAVADTGPAWLEDTAAVTFALSTLAIPPMLLYLLLRRASTYRALRPPRKPTQGPDRFYRFWTACVGGLLAVALLPFAIFPLLVLGYPILVGMIVETRREAVARHEGVSVLTIYPHHREAERVYLDRQGRRRERLRRSPYI